MTFPSTSSNFAFLAEHDPIFLQLASSAEQVFAADPNTTLIKLRQFGEALAQDLAARAGVEFDGMTSQADLLYKLQRQIQLDAQVREMFHILRIEGNKATHQFRTRHRDAMDGLKLARALAIWFHQSFGKAGTAFKPGPFIPPSDPSQALRSLQEEISQLRAELSSKDSALASNQQLAELIAQEKEQYAVLAEQMDAEARTYQNLAEEQAKVLERVQNEFEQRLQALHKHYAAAPAESQQAVKQIVQSTQSASRQLALNEELTRLLIDQQLNEAGWQADTQALTHGKGARPEKGKNLAIAEWPTLGRQAADYVLFAGLTPLAVVEAKRENEHVAGKIPQAERYARHFTPPPPCRPAWQVQGLSAAWPDGQGGSFAIPFVYASNSRPYLAQLAEYSGTWFRDVRHPANLAEAKRGFNSPQGLLDQLTRSKSDAEARLQQEGMAYLQLRNYQEQAIAAVETALAAGQRQCLLAMATGTGKTRTIIGLIYRFLKAERFRRILFLVDRNALGQQAQDAFAEATLEQSLPLSKLYNIAAMGDMQAEAETRVQVATIQAMVKRINQSETPPTIDAYDCLIIDEAHRGYTLDQEMSDGEIAVRDQQQYQSTYRQALDYFDAVKIALTATPAKHTSDIFGKPVFTYSYREAVADDWLIDHEPPIRYQTLLSQNGIKFAKGEQVSSINLDSGEIDTAELDDELNFDIDSFNRRVITKDFNRVICEQLAQELDPFGDEKTLIFCATDAHADLVKSELDTAFKAVHGDAYIEAAVSKITGKSDKIEQLIKRYKNDRFPNVAITVDLLTTGIDVPAICHLVFLRRVRSRILYEQMKGRATRRCDDIGKTVFKIYDPVDLYQALEAVDTMKPLVKDPDISLAQLVDELHNPLSFSAPGHRPERKHAHDVLDQLSQKLMRVLRRASHRADKMPAVKTRLAELEQHWGLPVLQLPQHLRQLGPQQAAAFLRQQANLVAQVEGVKLLLGSLYQPIISTHKDELKLREQNYGDYQKPEDYLDSFNHFIRTQINQSAALAVIVNRPKDLTREQLREVRLLLDQHGYGEARLQSAWRNRTNQDIAASIIGYIRQAALGEALQPFEQRVAQAMQGIYALTNWTPVQRKWLERLAKQLHHEVVIDQQFVNRAFAQDGGAKRVDGLLGGQLAQVLDTLAGGLWAQAA